MVPHPLGTRLPSSLGLLCTADRVGKYELRTAGACRAAPPVVLALRICSEGFGTTANQVQVLYSSGAQCGSATCFCGADLRAWFGLPCLFAKTYSILSYLTAFCIIRGFLHTCILSFPHFLFALFLFLFLFIPSLPAFPLLRPLVCRPEIWEYLVQKLHRVK